MISKFTQGFPFENPENWERLDKNLYKQNEGKRGEIEYPPTYVEEELTGNPQ